MGLAGWNSNQKLKLTIDNSKIDGDLTDFPVLITLSSGSGQTGFDTTAVFDELTTASGSYVNRKKIAVTTTISGVETELYVEIETWDDTTSSGNEQAWLWTKVPTIVSGTNTDLYLYYASTHADNVYELGNLCIHSDDTDGSTTFIDSSFSNHAITHGGDVHHETDQAKFGISSIYFDGVGDYLSMLDSEDWTFGTGDFTIDFWIKRGRTLTREMVWGQCVAGGAGTSISIRMEIAATDEIHFYLINVDKATGYYLNDTDWHHILVERHGTNLLLFVDGNLESTIAIGSGALVDSTTPWSIGRQGDYAGLYFQGYIDEYHIVKGTALHVSNFIPLESPYKMGYIGDVGETTSQKVWDSNFVGVWHMAQDPSGGAGCILDSTDNTNNGTPAGSMTSDDLVDGKAGKGLDLDGLDDKVTFSDISSSFSDKASLEMVLKLDANIPAVEQSGFGIFGTSIETSHYPYTDGTIYLETFRDDRLNLGVVGINKSNWHTLSITNEPGANNWKFYQNITEYYSTTGESSVSLPTDPNIGESHTTRHLDGIVCELRISNIARSESWIKATYYSNWDDLITYTGLTFIFTNPIPVHLSTVYGTSHTLQLTTTVSGSAPSYVYDAVFYDALDDSQIGSTVSGLNSGQSASTTMQTPSGIDYNWYLIATSSGTDGISSTYNFTNRFLCSGTTEVNNVLTADIPVRLYRRSTGELIGSTASISGGLFEIESTYNENHYAIAIHPTDSGTNALVYDWLIP